VGDEFPQFVGRLSDSIVDTVNPAYDWCEHFERYSRHVDLSDGHYFGKRNLSVMYIINPSLSGFIRLERDCQSGFLVVNTVGDTSKPEAANPAADTSENRP
jgi:hypothetical protein